MVVDLVYLLVDFGYFSVGWCGLVVAVGLRIALASLLIGCALDLWFVVVAGAAGCGLGGFVLVCVFRLIVRLFG